MMPETKLPQEAKMELLKIHLDSLKQIIIEKFDILSTISGLVATLLVIATFNEKLLQITLFVKVLLAILLAIMPISLFFKIINLHMGEISSLESIGEVVGKNAKDIIRENSRNKGKFKLIFDKIVAWSPYAILAIFSCIVIIIIFLLFQAPILKSC